MSLSPAIVCSIGFAVAGVAATLPASSLRAQEGLCGGCQNAQCIQRGEALERLGRHERARLCAEAALEQTPEAVAAHWLKRRVLIEVGDDDELLEHLLEMRAHVADPARRARLDEEIRALGGNLAPSPAPPQTPGSVWWYRLRSLLGLFGLLALGWTLSMDRRHVRWRFVFTGIGVQLVIALLLLRTPVGTGAFLAVRGFVDRVLSFSDQGIEFAFGALGRPVGSTEHPMVVDAVSGDPVALGLVLALHILPVLIFVGGLTGLLLHLNVVKYLIQGLTRALARSLGSGGVETLVAVSNVFLGYVQAPLLIRPYLSALSTAELFTVMTAGFATLASGVLAIYIQIGIDAEHLVTASVLSAPAALTIGQLVAPRGRDVLSHHGQIVSGDDNVIDAISHGALAGLRIAASVGALLITFVALVALIDWPLGALGTSLSELLGYLFLPIAWLIGIENGDLLEVGSLLGTKIALNEFLAYSQMLALRDSLSPRSTVLATYALCGFACLSSIGALVGSLGALMPTRRGEISRLGLRAMLAGALASSMTAAIAGMLL